LTKGLTAEELEEKGYIGDKNIEIKRNVETQVKTEKNYTFAEDVEYYKSELYKNIKEIPFEDIEHLKDVMPDSVIAEKKYSGLSSKSGSFHPRQCHSEAYLNSSNVSVNLTDGKLVYKSLIKGKIVLLNGLIYVRLGDIDGRFELRVSPDKMSVEADFYPAKGAGKMLTEKEIKSGLDSDKIIYGIRDNVISEHVEKAEKTGIAQKGVIVAEGTAAIDGIDAKIQLHFDPDPVYEDFKILSDGRVDYRKQLTIVVVKKGELLATIADPEKGIDGKDVYGNEIKGKDGEKKVLFAGTNVEKSEDGLNFYALLAGQPVLNKNILNVFAHYKIQGDVDYSSGNIQFDGNITINGSVLPGFEVKATGDIFVMKTVDSGILEAGRDIRVFGGIFGNNDSVVKCGRNLIVTHMQNAVVEAQGDVVIKDSAVHSKIYSTGNVILREGKGAIVGGMVHALRSVHAKVIGSPTGTKTEIIVGQDFFVNKMRDEFLKVQDFCTKNIEKLEKYLKPLVTMIKNGAKLQKDQMSKVTMVLKKHNEVKNQYFMIDAKMKEIEKASQTVKNPVVKVNQVIYPDVRLTIRDRTIIIAEKNTEVSYSFDAYNNTIIKGPY
jgi:uncharacterized protein (DUF342 family)